MVIIPHGLRFEYDLEVDGASIATGRSTDMDEIQKREFAKSRWSVGIFLILPGLRAGWINWNWAAILLAFPLGLVHAYLFGKGLY